MVLTSNMNMNHVFEQTILDEKKKKKHDREDLTECSMVTLLQPNEMLKSEQILHEAARTNNITLTKKLLSQRVDVNARNNLDRTPLHWAAAGGNTAIVDMLLYSKADIEAEDKYGMTALLYASWFGHLETVKSLVNKGANRHAKNRQGLNMVMCAAQHNNVDVLTFVKDELDQFNVNQVEKSEKSALHLAAEKGNYDSVAKLLEMKCDVTLKDKENGQTAVHYAATAGDCKMLALIFLGPPQEDEYDIIDDEIIQTPDEIITTQAKVNLAEHIVLRGVDENLDQDEGFEEGVPVQNYQESVPGDIANPPQNKDVLGQDQTGDSCQITTRAVVEEQNINQFATEDTVEQGNADSMQQSNNGTPNIGVMGENNAGVNEMPGDQSGTSLPAAQSEVSLARIVMDAPEGFGDGSEVPPTGSANPLGNDTLQLQEPCPDTPSTIKLEAPPTADTTVKFNPTESVNPEMSDSLQRQESLPDTPSTADANALRFSQSMDTIPVPGEFEDMENSPVFDEQDRERHVSNISEDNEPAKATPVDETEATKSPSLSQTEEVFEQNSVDPIIPPYQEPVIDQIGEHPDPQPVDCDVPLPVILEAQVEQIIMEPDENRDTEDATDGKTAVHVAAEYGHHDVLNQLMLVGVEVDDRDNDGQTALHLACKNGHTKAAELLLSFNADPNVENVKENTPLHLAGQEGKSDIVAMLIEQGVKLNAQNNQGNTALHLASLGNHPEVVRQMVDAYAELDLPNHRMQSALHAAVENGVADVVEVLLIAGANIEAKDKTGKTALAMASRGSYIGIVDMIIKADRHHLLHPQEELNTQASRFSDNSVQFKRPNHAATDLMKDALWKLAHKQLKTNDWKRLAYYWKFNDAHIRAIEHQYTGPNSYKEHGYRLLLIWLHGVKKDESPMKHLFESLVAIQRRDLAEQVRKRANLQVDKAAGQQKCVIS